MTVTPPPSGGPDGDLKSVLEAFESRTIVVEVLASEVTSLVAEVRGLRTALAHRPPRREIERKRRFTAVAVALWSLALIFVHDAHVERCAPGSRAAAVVDGFLSGESDPERLRALGRADTPFLCDASFPFHPHATPPEKSSAASVLGLALYAAAFGGALWWAAHPGGMTRRQEEEEIVELRTAADTKASKDAAA